MTVTEIKRRLLADHAQYGFFRKATVSSIIRSAQRQGDDASDVVCCMLELVYTSKNKER